MVLSIEDPPSRNAVLRMGCGYPCSANADIGRLLQALPANEWVRVSVDLKCFVDGGLNAANVDTPFLLITDRKMALSIALRESEAEHVAALPSGTIAVTDDGGAALLSVSECARLGRQLYLPSTVHLAPNISTPRAISPASMSSNACWISDRA